MTNTATKFGAKQIGGWRQGTIFDGDAFNYISHKMMHGALAAATSAATARLDHVKGPERRKRIMGAASGAMIAEAVGEHMMHGALANVEAKLNASGHAPDSKAYADLRTTLMSDELRKIKMFAQLAVAASAEAMRFDLNAAMFAANNALENNFSQVFTALAFGKARADEVDDEADQQAYGKARKKAIDAITPELAKKYGQAAAEYAYHLSLGPDGYAEAMLEAQTGGRKLTPEVRQVLLDAHSEHYFDMLHAFNVMQGMGAIGDALGSGAEYALRKAGLDRATARNIHRAINDGLTVTGVAGAVKGVAKVSARGASSSAKAATRTSLDGLGLEGAGQKLNAASAVNSQKLMNQLRAEQIVKGHAFKKHVLEQGEFPGIRTYKQLQNHVEFVLNAADSKRYVVGPGRMAYIHEPSHTVVVRDLLSQDGGTVFQPKQKMSDFLKDRKWSQK